MSRCLDGLKAIALAVACGVGIAMLVLLLQISAAVKRAEVGAAGMTARVNAVLDQAENTARLSGKLVNDARLSADNVNKAAIDERMYFEQDLPPLTAQAGAILSNVREATGELTQTAHQATATLQAGETSISAAGPLLNDSDAAVRHLDELVTSPAVTDSLAHVDASTASIAAASVQADAILADGRLEADKYTHPPKKKLGFWGATEAAGDWLRHFMPPIL